jgi:ectoine hydroxylase-related dioxygenase (phytanoyl-CoA dioxygenase family)
MELMQISRPESNVHYLYDTNGYVTIKEIISNKALQRLQADFLALFQQRFSEISSITELDRKIIMLEREDPTVLYDLQVAASRLASFYAVTGEIYDSLTKITRRQSGIYLKALGFLYGIPQNQRLSYDWHQDGTYHESDRDVTIHVWFPLFYPARLENGAMSMLKNSHRLGLLGYEKHKFNPNGYTTNRVSDIDEYVKSHIELVCSMDPGDCMFFSDELIHKSNINFTNKCRIAGVMKFSTKPSISDHSGLVGV